MNARKVTTAALTLAFLAAGASSAMAVPLDGGNGGNTSGAKTGYIVTLKDGVAPTGLAKALNVDTKHVYSHVLNGFSADLTKGQVNALEHNKSVLSIEADQVASIVPDAQTEASNNSFSVSGFSIFGSPSTTTKATTQSLATNGSQWNLDRIDQTATRGDYKYNYTAKGTGVTAYVIDTGIDTTHADFGGRASTVYDGVDGTNTDCNGHGTHVAGTIGGTKYGVAKNVTLKAVRVLDCTGNGYYSTIIAGMDYVAANHTGPSVVNMSLAGGFSQDVNDAVARLTASGVFVAVAAGNEGQDSNNDSPASAPSAMTVGATDNTDTRASFSNYGAGVDIYAPGVSVLSDWPNGQVNTESGTSMASPAVAGAAALYLSTGTNGTATPATVSSWLTTNATSGVVKSNMSGTVNLLLNKRAL